MTHIKQILSAAVVALTLSTSSSPASADSYTTINRRSNELSMEIQKLQVQYQNSPESSRRSIRKQMTSVMARKIQLESTMRRKSKRSKYGHDYDDDNKYMIKHHRRYVASPSSPYDYDNYHDRGGY